MDGAGYDEFGSASLAALRWSFVCTCVCPGLCSRARSCVLVVTVRFRCVRVFRARAQGCLCVGCAYAWLVRVDVVVDVYDCYCGLVHVYK